MGKPIVVGAHGVVGFKEQVISSGPDQNGIHVNGGDAADIAWGVKQVLKDPDRAQKWGRKGRERVRRYFTWKKAAEQTLQIYRSLQDNVDITTDEALEDYSRKRPIKVKS